MGEVLILTPVTRGQVTHLRRQLDGLPRDRAPTAPDERRAVPRSPFSGALPPTHFARLVVIELDDVHHLLFSSRFDGPVREYLMALAATETALAIWDHCHWPGRDEHGALTGDELRAYLCQPDHHLSPQYVVSAFPAGVTVAQVNAALRLRTQVSRLAARATTLDQWALAHEFRQLPGVRRLLSRP